MPPSYRQGVKWEPRRLGSGVSGVAVCGFMQSIWLCHSQPFEVAFRSNDKFITGRIVVPLPDKMRRWMKRMVTGRADVVDEEFADDIGQWLGIRNK